MAEGNKDQKVGCFTVLIVLLIIGGIGKIFDGCGEDVPEFLPQVFYGTYYSDYYTSKDYHPGKITLYKDNTYLCRYPGGFSEGKFKLTKMEGDNPGNWIIELELEKSAGETLGNGKAQVYVSHTGLKCLLLYSKYYSSSTPVSDTFTQ